MVMVNSFLTMGPITQEVLNIHSGMAMAESSGLIILGNYK